MLAARKNRKCASGAIAERIKTRVTDAHAVSHSMHLILAKGHTMTNEELRARIAELESQLQSSRTKRLTLRVSVKGGLSVYGLGKFPVSLYTSQWERLIAFVPDIQAFLNEHKAEFATKPAVGARAEAEPA